MKKIAPLWIACAALAALPALAQKDCSKADAAAAEKAVDRVVNPGGLYKAFRDHGHCDKPPVEDIFTDAVLRLMVEWKDPDTLATDAQRDPAYKAFLFKHVKSPAAKDDRESIHSRAKSNCPMTQGAFCAEVIEVAKGGGAKKDDLLAPLPTIPAPKK
jgi:hypothetical protein